MPQGSKRTKVSIPSASKKKGQTNSKRHNSSNKIRKGGRTIAPTKQKNIQAAVLKKTIQRAIDSHIEKEVLLQAGKNNVGFTLLKSDKEKEAAAKKQAAKQQTPSSSK